MVDLLRRFFVSGMWLMGFNPNPKKVRCPTCGYYERIKRENAKLMGLQYELEPGLCFYNPPTSNGFGRTEKRGWCRHHTELEIPGEKK